MKYKVRYHPGHKAAGVLTFGVVVQACLAPAAAKYPLLRRGRTGKPRLNPPPQGALDGGSTGRFLSPPIKWRRTAGVKVAGMFGVFGGLLVGLYFLVIVVVAVLVVWVLILAIIFLKLRIAEIRGTTGPAGRSE